MKYRDFNFDLCYRFISDYNFPIVLTGNAKSFFYNIKFYEKAYQTRTKWRELVKIINTYYNGNPGLFLDEYYKIRDNMITYVSNLDSYKEFNTNVDAYKQWKQIELPASKYKSPYNGETVNKSFIAVDMRKANFSALKYIGVLTDADYRAFVARFVDGPMQDYVYESKYTRQVVFGKLNPNRQITVEKMIMNDIYKDYVLKHYPEAEMVYFGSDEFIFTVPGKTNTELMYIAETINLLVETAPVKLRVEHFSIEGYEFYAQHEDKSIHKLGEFYHRSCDHNEKYKGLPAEYGKIILKTMKNKRINDMDRLVMHNKAAAKLLDNFIVKKMGAEEEKLSFWQRTLNFLKIRK